MFDRGKSGYVNGLVTLRATQLHKRAPRYSSHDQKEPEDKPKAASKASGATASKGIGRTVMPTQNEIVCYACGYHFVIRGRAEATQCPKCGARLSLKNETITGGFRDELITAGKVTVTRNAIVDGATIQTNDLSVSGMIKSGDIKVYRTLELLEGFSIPEEMIITRHLRIGPGAVCKINKPLQVENLEIEGVLEGTIIATGEVVLRSNGHFIGSLTTEHLQVEEGAGLTAQCEIAPPAPPKDKSDVDEPDKDTTEDTKSNGH